jgi:hypothetical protein
MQDATINFMFLNKYIYNPKFLEKTKIFLVSYFNLEF